MIWRGNKESAHPEDVRLGWEGRGGKSTVGTRIMLRMSSQGDGEVDFRPSGRFGVAERG